MRGSPGPPGPIVSIRGFLAHLRSSQRGHNAQTPLYCLVSGKLGRAERGGFCCPLLSLIRASVGTVAPPPSSPLELACSVPLCLWSCLGETLKGTLMSPCPRPRSVLHHGPRLPWQEGLGFWLMVSAARKVYGNLARSLHASVTPVTTGASIAALLCEAISRTGLRRPDQGCLVSLWQESRSDQEKSGRTENAFFGEQVAGGSHLRTREPPGWGPMEVRWQA